MIEQFQGEYRWLSNFTAVPIRGTEYTYPSVEHAYVSAKSDNPQWKIICAHGNHSAGALKKLGQRVHIRPDWPTFKLRVMEVALRQKYNQEPFKSLLRATGDELIQEGNYWNDRFWGVCLKTGQGENRLGRMIMQIREELRAQI